MTLGGELHSTKGQIAGWTIDEYGLWSDNKTGIGLFTTYPSSSSIAGSPHKNDWRIVAGNQFGVDKNGNLYAGNAHIIGSVTSYDGIIGGWHISEHGLSSGNWQSESHITETDDIIAITEDSVQHIYFDAHEGTMFNMFAKWDWIIESARAWAEANSRV